MCFYSDPDWTADVCEDEVTTATKPTYCDECRRTIPSGGWCRHIFMQENEWCRHNPASDDYDGPETDGCSDLPDESDCPEGCEHDYGEVFNYDRCESCDQLIEAIHQHELEEGCSDYESRPNLMELYDAMNEGDGKAYLAKAEAIYPGITGRLPERFLWFREDDSPLEAHADED